MIIWLIVAAEVIGIILVWAGIGYWYRSSEWDAEMERERERRL